MLCVLSFVRKKKKVPTMKPPPPPLISYLLLYYPWLLKMTSEYSSINISMLWFWTIRNKPIGWWRITCHHSRIRNFEKSGLFTQWLYYQANRRKKKTKKKQNLAVFTIMFCPPYTLLSTHNFVFLISCHKATCCFISLVEQLLFLFHPPCLLLCPIEWVFFHKSCLV